jgi:hypothetical protein
MQLGGLLLNRMDTFRLFLNQNIILTTPFGLLIQTLPSPFFGHLFCRLKTSCQGTQWCRFTKAIPTYGTPLGVIFGELFTLILICQ